MFKTGFIKLNKNVQSEEKKSKTIEEERGVVYLGHIPHGFYEKEMNNYFSQFGEVTNINIPKSKKTGKARGYAFIEFMYPEVAKVVAETMNNYLMHKKILVAKYLPPNQVKSNTFWRCNKKNIPLTIKNRSIQRKVMERLLDPEQKKQKKSLLRKHIHSLQSKFKKKGIEYDIQLYNPKLEVPNESIILNEIKENDDLSLLESSSESDTKMKLYNNDKKNVPQEKNKKNKIITKKSKRL